MHSINQLAKQMYSRKETGERPYVLFLGAGVSISSGISSMIDMIDRFLIDIGTASGDLEKMDGEQRFEKFLFAMQNLSEIDRYNWLCDGFKNATPSFGYQALIKLIEDGYFDTILTTNWDELLEDSLKRSNKLKDNKDYRVYVRGVDRDDYIIGQFRSHVFPKIKIVKLHGELESRVIYVTPKETANFPPDFANFLRDDFFRSRDLIMIGYSVLDQDVKNCVDPLNNSLYYVNPKPPVDDVKEKFRRFEQIVGDNAKFDTFMSSLSDTISQHDLRVRLGVPHGLLEKISADIRKIHEDFDTLVAYLKDQQKH